MVDEPTTTIGAGLTSNVPEPEPVPAGEQYEIRLNKVEVRRQKPEKGSGSFVMAFMSILGVIGAAPFNHVMMLPDGEDSDQDYRRNLDLQHFYNAFSINHEPGEAVELTEGLRNTTFAILKVTHSDDYGDQNGISRYVKEQ